MSYLQIDFTFLPKSSFPAYGSLLLTTTLGQAASSLGDGASGGSLIVLGEVDEFGGVVAVAHRIVAWPEP